MPQLVEIICYCLNPNHYHFLLKQKQDKGISRFMHKFGTSYTNFFNTKYRRSGSLFQGKYKAVQIKTDEQLIYTSAYINANAEIHYIAKAEEWQYSSYLDYLNKRSGTLCDKKVIMSLFDNDVLEYQTFVGDVIRNSREIKDEIKRCLLDV